MAYKGGIDFFFIEGETAIWEDKRLVSPWSRRRGSDNVTKELDGKNTAVIVARAYVYEVELEQDGAVPTLITDVPGASVDNETRCVIVGTEIKQPEQDDNNRMCYILIVRPASGHWRPTVVGYPNYRAYKRIGAGSIPKRCISEGDEGENILII
jgi:hypothetical protein